MKTGILVGIYSIEIKALQCLHACNGPFFVLFPFIYDFANYAMNIPILMVDSLNLM